MSNNRLRIDPDKDLKKSESDRLVEQLSKKNNGHGPIQNGHEQKKNGHGPSMIGQENIHTERLHELVATLKDLFPRIRQLSEEEGVLKVIARRVVALEEDLGKSNSELDRCRDELSDARLNNSKMYSDLKDTREKMESISAAARNEGAQKTFFGWLSRRKLAKIMKIVPHCERYDLTSDTPNK